MGTLRPPRPETRGKPLLPSASRDGPAGRLPGYLLQAQSLPRRRGGRGGAPAAGPPPFFIELGLLLPLWGRGAGFNGWKCPGFSCRLSTPFPEGRGEGGSAIPCPVRYGSAG